MRGFILDWQKIKNFFFFWVVLLLVSCNSSLEEIKKNLNEKKYNQALEQLAPLVKKENKDALYLMSSIYHYGLGVEKDQKKSDEFMLRAAKRGLKEAQYNVGVFFTFGWPSDAKDSKSFDFDLATFWYWNAAKQNMPMSSINYGVLSEYSKNAKQKDSPVYLLKWNEGDALAEYNLGFSYFYGQGAVLSYEKAYGYFLSAKSKGILTANTYLGYLLLYGLGTKKNAHQAILFWLEYLEKAEKPGMQWLSNVFLEKQSLFYDPPLANAMLEYCSQTKKTTYQTIDSHSDCQVEEPGKQELKQWIKGRLEKTILLKNPNQTSP